MLHGLSCSAYHRGQLPVMNVCTTRVDKQPPEEHCQYKQRANKQLCSPTRLTGIAYTGLTLVFHMKQPPEQVCRSGVPALVRNSKRADVVNQIPYVFLMIFKTVMGRHGAAGKAREYGAVQVLWPTTGLE